jgi:hypothetical protein
MRRNGRIDYLEVRAVSNIVAHAARYNPISANFDTLLRHLEQALEVSTGDIHINVIIPGDKTLMANGAQQGTSTE